MTLVAPLAAAFFLAGAQPANLIAVSDSGAARLADCGLSGGVIAGPFAPTPSVARHIFSAVLGGLRPPAPPLEHTRIVVDDKGDRWEVYSVVLRRTRSGRYGPAQGGGYGMTIDKCTGAVSRVGGIR